MLNIYNSDDEAHQYYLTTYRKILKIAPGLVPLIESHRSSTKLANITWKASFFKVYVHICACGGANNGDGWSTSSITRDWLMLPSWRATLHSMQCQSLTRQPLTLQLWISMAETRWVWSTLSSRASFVQWKCLRHSMRTPWSKWFTHSVINAFIASFQDPQVAWMWQDTYEIWQLPCRILEWWQLSQRYLWSWGHMQRVLPRLHAHPDMFSVSWSSWLTVTMTLGRLHSIHMYLPRTNIHSEYGIEEGHQVL